MKRVNWFSGQQVQKEDLSYLQESLAGEISSRTSSQYSKGIISPVSTYVGVDVDQTLVIHPFRAYTESGEQIVIPEDKVEEFKSLLVSYYEGKDIQKIKEFLKKDCYINIKCK